VGVHGGVGVDGDLDEEDYYEDLPDALLIPYIVKTL
jgi:hypothetical protein